MFTALPVALFSGVTPTAYLTTVKSWLDANPDEVLTFLFTNPEGLSLPDVWAPVFEASGIAPLAYVPPHVPMKRTEWPPLGELIDAGTRVVVFLDAGADGADGTVDYILPEFQMVRYRPSVVHMMLTYDADLGTTIRLDRQDIPVLCRPYLRPACDVGPYVPPQPLP